jgi:F0F1-type ATP synthase assembly protein I
MSRRLAQRRMYDELDRADKLDSKANSLITLSGVLAGFFLGIITNQITALSTLPKYEVGVLLLGVAFLVASVFYSLRAFRVRKWAVVPDPKVLIDKYKDRRYLETLRTVTTEMSEVQVEMVKSNNQKAGYVSTAWNLLIGGLGITFIFVIVAFFL